MTLDEQEEEIRNRAREKGRRLAAELIRTIDPVFSPRKLDADDAKVIFHPVDFVVFDGMSNGGTISQVLFLDRDDRKGESRRLQRHIERAISRDQYEWRTLRVHQTGNVTED